MFLASAEGVEIVKNASLALVVIVAAGGFLLFAAAVVWGIRNGKVFRSRSRSVAARSRNASSPSSG